MAFDFLYNDCIDLTHTYEERHVLRSEPALEHSGEQNRNSLCPEGLVASAGRHALSKDAPAVPVRAVQGESEE